MIHFSGKLMTANVPVMNDNFEKRIMKIYTPKT